MPSRPAFGTLLRKVRLGAGLSQEALAERARISTQAIGALERGTRSAPRRDTLELLIAALALTGAARADFESAALASVKARIRTGDVRAHVASFPNAPTSFVGRTRECGEVADMLTPGRCTTIWGAGGIGKTRLALETARSVLERYPDGAWFVELAPLSVDADVVRAVAVALGVREESERSLEASIVSRLRGARALLVLDNAEHVLLGCATLVERLLRDAPDVTMACTSREPLRIAGENVFPLQTLPVPNPRDPALARAPAVRLFLDRATSAGAAIPETADTLRTIAEICGRLDAIPLAIELASARTPLMSPAQIARALDDRFRLLTAGNRTAAARQKTLFEAIDWSFALVSDRERVVLRRLAVWPGTWTLDDALALMGEDIDRWDVIGAIASLVDRSLVVALPIEPNADRRYRLLHTTRAYAVERAIEGGDFEPGRRRQAERIASFLTFAEDRWRDGDHTAMMSLEAAAVREALRWSIEARFDVPLGARIAGKAAIFWSTRLLESEGLRWIADAMAALPPDAVAERTIALLGRARMCRPMLRRLDTYVAAREAFALADRAGDLKSAAIARLMVAEVAATSSDKLDEARRELDAAKAIFERIGDETGLDTTRWTSAILANRSGEYASARVQYEALIDRYLAEGNVRLRLLATQNLAEAEFAAGDARGAIARASRGLADARASALTLEIASLLQNLAGYFLATDATSDATAAARESLEIFWANGYGVHTTISIGHVAELLARTGRERDAARLLGFGNERLRAFGWTPGVIERRSYERAGAACERGLGVRAFEAALAEGATLDGDEAAQTALDLVVELHDATRLDRENDANRVFEKAEEPLKSDSR